MEIWKIIPNTLYEASSLGRVRSVERTIFRMSRWGFDCEIRLKSRVLKPWSDSNGYLVVYICGDGRRDPINVHRLIAQAFIQSAEGRNDVNHLDGNKQNNVPQNLEWCTKKENMAHARKTGLYSPNKPIKGTPIKGGDPIFFDSEKAAAAAIGVKRGNISSAATGKLKQAHGYFWSYIT